MTKPLLALHSLGFRYPDASPLLMNWSTTIEPGLTLLYGDTGSGKTTVLRILAGVLPAGGRMTLSDVALVTDPDAYRRACFWADPASDAFEQVTARDCTAALRAGDAGFDEAAWAQHSDAFALAPHLDKPMYMLSTGSRRKVLLAAALASGRPLTLLDEPTGALDAPSIRHLMACLTALASNPERAIVLASWDRPALPFARVIELPLANPGS